MSLYRMPVLNVTSLTNLHMKYKCATNTCVTGVNQCLPVKLTWDSIYCDVAL